MLTTSSCLHLAAARCHGSDVKVCDLRVSKLRPPCGHPYTPDTSNTHSANTLCKPTLPVLIAAFCLSTLQGLGGHYDLILASETLYSLDSQLRLLECIKQVCNGIRGRLFCHSLGQNWRGPPWLLGLALWPSARVSAASAHLAHAACEKIALPTCQHFTQLGVSSTHVGRHQVGIAAMVSVYPTSLLGVSCRCHGISRQVTSACHS